MATNLTLDQLRAEIERRYREALAAFEIVSAYVAGPENYISQEELLARAYDRELEARKRVRKKGAQAEPQGKAAEVVAKANGVSAATVKRAVKAQREREILAGHDQNGDGNNEFRPGQPR